MSSGTKGTQERGKRNLHENRLRDPKTSLVRSTIIIVLVGSQSDCSQGTKLCRKAAKKMKLDTLERRFTHKPEYLG